MCIVAKDRSLYIRGPGPVGRDPAPILLPLALTLLFERDSVEMNSRKLVWDVLNLNLKLYALRYHTERLERLERDRDSLLKSYVGLVPEAIDALGSEERHRMYRMISMKAYLTADGMFELSGDVMNFASLEISSA